MNMITTQGQALRPGPDELVPSRYALRVGEIDVLVVSDGVLSLPGATMATNADPAVRAAWLNDMFLPPDVFDWALNAVVVRSGGRTILIDAGLGMEYPDFAAGRAVGPATGGRRHRSRVRDRRGADPHAHGPRWRAARRRGEGPAASGPAGPRGGRRGQVLGVARFLPHLHAAGGFRTRFGRAAKRFLNEYRGQLRPFEEEYEVAPGVVVRRTGGHTPGHSVVRLASGGDRLTFAGDAVFPVRFDHPDWHNGFEHDPEEAARVRVRLLRELAASRRAAGGHSPAVPVRLPCGGRRRRLSLGTGRLGLLTACWVSAQKCADATVENWKARLAGVEVRTSRHCQQIINALRVD